jgi:hypothetical protein
MSRYFWAPPIGVIQELQCRLCSDQDGKATFTSHEYKEHCSGMTAEQWWECRVCGSRVRDNLELLEQAHHSHWPA